VFNRDGLMGDRWLVLRGDQAHFDNSLRGFRPERVYEFQLQAGSPAPEPEPARDLAATMLAQ
jgi:hypothetical protein